MTDVNLFINNLRTAIISLLFVGSGNAIEAVNSMVTKQSYIATAFQHAAWTVGIIAGVVGIINGIDSIRVRRKKVDNGK
jgi:hypothetical protein